MNKCLLLHFSQLQLYEIMTKYHLGNNAVGDQEEDGQQPFDLQDAGQMDADDGGLQGMEDTGNVKLIYI